MDYLELLKSFFTVPACIALIIAVVNWFKMIPGAENENLKAVWPGVAAGVGMALQAAFIMLTGQVELLGIALFVGFVEGMAAAGLYKIADKVSNG